MRMDQAANTVLDADGPVRDPLAKPVTAGSLVDEIAERFRQAVIVGVLKPGDAINESQLAERLSVARGTLREAVRILIGEGLLEKLPNRPSRVRFLSPEKAWEVMTARAVFEGFAAHTLAQRLTPEKLAQLTRIWEQQALAAEANDPAGFLRWDFRLHEAIVQLSGHGVLIETWTKMSAWVRLMFASEQHLPTELLRNAATHKAVIDAIASGDPDQAEMRLKADLLDQKELERSIGLAEDMSGQPERGNSQAGQASRSPNAGGRARTGS